MVKRYTDFVTGYARAIVFFVVLATAILGYYAQYLSIDASAETLLLENDADLKLTREVHGRYISPDYLLVAYTPSSDMLSDTTIKTIHTLKASLLDIKGVESVTTLLDVPLLESPPIAITEVVKNVRTLSTPDTNRTLAQKELSTSPLYANNLVSGDFKTTAILINLKEDSVYTKLLQARNAFIELQATRELSPEEQKQFSEAKMKFKAYNDANRDTMHQLIENVRRTLKPFQEKEELFLGGVMMISDDMIGFVKNDIALYGTAIVLIMILMLWIIFRQLRFVVLPILISAAALIITTGINALLGIEITVVSSNYVAMQLITTLSLVIHLIVSYREEYLLFPDATQKELIGITLKRMSIPSVFIILTSYAGFGSLMTCDILPIIDLGIMMSIGVTISLVVAYLLFPAIMMLLAKKPPVMVFDKSFTLNTTFAHIVEHHAKKVIAVVLLLLVLSAYGVTQLFVENSFINYFKQDTEIYKGMQKIDHELGGTTPLEIVVTFPEVKTEAKASDAQSDDLLDSFEDEFAQNTNDAKYWFTPEKMQTIERVHNYLDALPQVGNVSSLATLSKVGRIVKEGKDFDNFEYALLYNELSLEYKKILLLPYVNTEHNEARFVIRLIDSDPHLRRNALLAQIKEELVTKVGLEPQNVKLVGMMVLYNNMLQSLFNSQIATLGLALLLLGSMFLFLFRSFKIALLAMTVNMVPISIIFGIMGIAGIPLDMMSITIASIALGITVDNTIHYLYRFREELGHDGDYVASMHRAHGTIAFGMFYYSLATIVGFLVLVTSNFIPTLIFGLLTVIVLLVATVSDLVFSPLLVLIFKPFGSKK